VSLGYLRSFLTLLVVAHHAVLAYHRYAPPRPASLTESMIWAAFPIVDASRWPGIELFVGFNDIFFMSLMFMISGIFAWPSLERKGGMRFFRDRLGKLGAAFVVSAAVLAPLAYYPTFLSMAPQSVPFWRQWVALPAWPAGPAWFLWVLVVLAAVAAAVHSRARGAYLRLGRLGERPWAFFAALVGLGALGYLPMAAAFTVFHWGAVGPFAVQSSRVLLYAVFFFVGVAVGSRGAQEGLLSPDQKLARRWPAWTAASVVAFGLSVVAFVMVLSTLSKGGPGFVLGTASNLAFVLSAAASSLAFVSLFVRFARRPNRLMDSISANAFGIYLLHYACVSWLQWAFLGVAWSGWAKGTSVFALVVLASWALSAAFRRLLFARPSRSTPTPWPAAPASTVATGRLQ
jgi:hypothetical protein